MDILKIEIYKPALKDVSQKYERAKELINSRIEEICSQEMLSVEEVIYFYVFKSKNKLFTT